MSNNIFIHYLEHAPAGFHGFVSHNEDDTYSIFLDPNDSSERILKTLMHEIDHIDNADFQKECVQDIEQEAHEA